MRALKFGDRGRDVYEMQMLLNVPTVDGIFGPKTARMLSAWGIGVRVDAQDIYGLQSHLKARKFNIPESDRFERLAELYNARTPYIWGGKIVRGRFNNQYNGLDCSGLVTAIWDDVFDPVMCNAACIWDKVKHVKRPEPMDLVFFGKEGHPTHVGIIVDYHGGMVGMQGGSRSTTKPTSGAVISYLHCFAYRDDIIGFGRVVS